MLKNAPQKQDNQAVAEVKEQVRSTTPAVDIFETETAFRVVADVPGVEREDISLSLEDDTLSFEARARHDKRYPDGLRYLRTFSIGKGINLDDVQADLKHGVLTISLPKAEAAKPKLIEVRSLN